MVLEKSIPRKPGEPDIVVWCCQHCRVLQSPEKRDDSGAVILVHALDRRVAACIPAAQIPSEFAGRWTADADALTALISAAGGEHAF